MKIAFVLFLFITSLCEAQTRKPPVKRSLDIVFRDINYRLKAKYLNDTITGLSGRDTIKVILFDYYGTSYLKLKRATGKYCEGFYYGSPDILEDSATVKVLLTGKTAKVSDAYYAPQRCGKWYFFDKQGILIDSIFYQTGCEMYK